MACCNCLIFLTVFVSGLSTLLYYFYNKYFPTVSKPNVEEKWWGPQESQDRQIETEIVPFKIEVSEDIIKDLNYRLQNAFPFEPSLTKDQSAGINSNILTTIVDYWKKDYDWKTRQEYLNKYPQFKTKIQGLNIHFVHVIPQVSKEVAKVPLLLLHGWPSTFVDFYEMVPLMTKEQKGRNFVFELVIPSLPGYGFSDAPKTHGLCHVHMSIVLKNLMKRLGYNKFYIQGGDWGALLVQNMATLYPEHILGVHTTMPYVDSPLAKIKTWLGEYFPSLVGISSMEYKKLYPLSEFEKVMYNERGYSHLHCTKPDTVGVALRESPAGLAAYILEKFTTWSNRDWQKLEVGGLLKKYTIDQLIDNVMIYWVTRSIVTSLRLYYNTFNTKINLYRVPVTVPAGIARFYHELFFFPKAAVAEKFVNLVHYREYTDGGHFPAIEVPAVLVEDIFEFVEKTRYQ